MSAHSFVAHFLKENGYHRTLKMFEDEHGSLISSSLPLDESLTDILADRFKYLKTEEKPMSSFDQLLDKDLERIKSTELRNWQTPYPKNAREIGPVSDLVVDCVIMAQNGKRCGLLGTSGKALVVVDLTTGKEIMRVNGVLKQVVIRRMVVAGDLVLLCGMNGKVSVGEFSENFQGFTILSETQIHPRLVVDVKVVTFCGKPHLISMGWDFYVKVFEVQEQGLRLVGEPFKLTVQGSCLDAVVYQDKLYVVVCKNEITLMDVLCMDERKQIGLEYRIALNDAEFSAAGFTPRSVQIMSKKGGVPLVAVGTSHEPYMRVVIVTLKDVGKGQSDHSVIRRNQILANLNTYSAQDKYSESRLRWRPDGSGIWIIGEDGVLRGLDVVRETVDVQLEAHKGRIKCICFDGEEILSCGTDRKVLLWK